MPSRAQAEVLNVLAKSGSAYIGLCGGWWVQLPSNDGGFYLAKHVRTVTLRALVSRGWIAEDSCQQSKRRFVLAELGRQVLERQEQQKAESAERFRRAIGDDATMTSH